MYRLYHRLCSSATPLDWLLSRNLKQRKLIFRAFSDFPRKLAPMKITRHTVIPTWSILVLLMILSNTQCYTSRQLRGRLFCVDWVRWPPIVLIATICTHTSKEGHFLLFLPMHTHFQRGSFSTFFAYAHTLPKRVIFYFFCPSLKKSAKCCTLQEETGLSCR